MTVKYLHPRPLPPRVLVERGCGEPAYGPAEMKECGGQVFLDAKVCPHCGKTLKRKTSFLAKAVSVLVVIIAIGVIANTIEELRKSPAQRAAEQQAASKQAR